MADSTHDRSWSLPPSGDQQFQFMFAHDAPAWDTNEPFLEFEWPADDIEHHCQQPDGRIPHIPMQVSHNMPWSGIANPTMHDTPSNTVQGYPSPMIEGSPFATTSSVSSMSMIPTSTQLQLEATGLEQAPRQVILDTPGLDAPTAPATSYSQLLVPTMPTASQIPRRPSVSSGASMLPPRPSSPRTREMSRYATLNEDGTWACKFDRCSSHLRFRRACDLRKHYNRHLTRYHCTNSSCPEAEVNGGNGFSSKKDCVRHEQSHDPRILCEWETCTKVFSRKDNMRDHVKRIHMRPRPRRRATTTN